MRPGTNPIEVFFVIVLNWVVPGLGFIIKGRVRHGILLFVILNLTFVIGLSLHGSVVVPSFDRSSVAFNWINVLTFICQLGNGGMSLFCAIHEQLQWGWYTYQDWHPWADLAALYFLVCGAMNYFATCNLWDRFYGREEDKEAVGHDG